MTKKSKKLKIKKNAVLLLNQHNLPLNVMPLDRALHMWVKGKTDIVEAYEDRFFYVWGDKFAVPTVMRMRYFVNITKKRQLKDFYNRLNVWRRDKGKCQYCGKEVNTQNFTVDHVLPRKKGGKTNWKNIVTCCFKCNNYKDCRTPEEAGMKLLSIPDAPNIEETIEQSILDRFTRICGNVHSDWDKYLIKKKG